MAELSSSRYTAEVRPPRWPERYAVVGLFFLATVICYLDRVSISVAIIPISREFGYDAAAQGVILSAFFWGYLWPQLAGGWMADRYGGHRVLALGVALWSLATFATPHAAASSLAALVAARVVLGLGEGVNFPSIHSLTARWALPSERSRVISLNFSGMYLGTVLALLLSPVVIATLGWPALFYISGAIGAVWVLAWTLRASSSPEESARIDESERAAIMAARTAAPRAGRVPWRRIAGERAVWAIIIAHFCSNFGFNILLLWLPTYLHHTFGVPLLRVGVYALVPWVTSFGAVNSGGWISDWMVARGMSVGAVRKTMQSTAFALGAIPLLLLPMAHSASAAVATVALSACANGVGLAAYGVNHLDVGPTYAGILMGISNSFATLPGIIGVAATGFMVRATGSFAAVFYMIAAVYGAGLLFYLLWASGDQRI